MTDAAIATISIIIVVHGILLFRLGRGLAWWLGRLLDAAEAFQHAVWFGFVPMARLFAVHILEAHARLTAKDDGSVRCPSHRNYNGCELNEGHPGLHRAGGLTWGEEAWNG